MSFVFTSRESALMLSGAASIGVVNARPAIRRPDTFGNRIPDWAASNSHSVSTHLRVRSR